MIDTETCEVLWRYLGDEYFVGMSFYSEEEALTLITSDGIIMFDYETGEQRALYEEDYSFGRYLLTDVSGRYVITKASGKLNVYDVVDGSLSYEIIGGEIISDSSAVAVSPSMKYLATSSKTTDSLQLYAVDALREGETECLCEVESINATYVENMFFNEREEYASGLTLYVVYKNGDIKIYGVDEQNQKLYEDGGLQDLHTCMTHSIQPENADYGVIVGDECAYLIEEADLTDFSNQGKITAHIDGFLAVDGNRNCIYLTDRTNIYRVNIYDETMLREEAERQLGIRK
ncbi:MAG: hypothetical protein K2M82_03540 [Lachnospiraceae bacterium]|nr:hypothetical protein [Lachnospiraceae bacterium]